MREAGGAFGKMEVAREEEYFRRLVCSSLHSLAQSNDYNPQTTLSNVLRTVHTIITISYCHTVTKSRHFRVQDQTCTSIAYCNATILKRKTAAILMWYGSAEPAARYPA